VATSPLPLPGDPIPPIGELWQIPLWPEEWAAAALGLTVEQLQTYRYKKGLPSSMLGKHAYYLRDSVLAWFAQNEAAKVPRG
jgi:hypothetical protein